MSPSHPKELLDREPNPGARDGGISDEAVVPDVGVVHCDIDARPLDDVRMRVTQDQSQRLVSVHRARRDGLIDATGFS